MMSETLPSRRTGRSISAVLAGFLAIVILSLGTDEILHALGVYPPWGQSMSDRLFLLATAYRVIYGVVGGYIVARLAPNRPMQHALINGGIGFIVGSIGAVATWNMGVGPHWYSMVVAATAVPCAWVGGRLRFV